MVSDSVFRTWPDIWISSLYRTAFFYYCYFTTFVLLTWTSSVAGVWIRALFLGFSLTLTWQVISVFWGHKVWPTFSVCPCLGLAHARWMGSSYFCVCSAFINIALLGDKLMSPGSPIATSQLFVTLFVPHHMLWTTFATNTAVYFRAKWDFRLLLFSFIF